MAPTSWNGSVTIYYKFIRPLGLRHEKKIDSGIDKVIDAGRVAFDEGWSPLPVLTNFLKTVKAALKIQ